MSGMRIEDRAAIEGGRPTAEGGGAPRPRDRHRREALDQAQLRAPFGGRRRLRVHVPEEIPEGRVLRLEGAGHGVYRDDWDAIVDHT